MLEGLTQQETASSVKQAASWCLAAAAASARAFSRAPQTSNTGVTAFLKISCNASDLQRDCGGISLSAHYSAKLAVLKGSIVRMAQQQ